MRSPTSSKILVVITLSSLLLSAFILSSPQNCSVSSIHDRFTGGECTAEAIHAQTLWISDNNRQAVLNDKLILAAAVVVVFTLIRRLLPIKIDIAKRLWMRAQTAHREQNLFHKKIFLPYLFATHGW